MTVKILLLGKAGQLGSVLEPALARLGTVVGVSRETGVDLTRTDTVMRCLEHTTPDIVVNATAYTAVDKAESEVALAKQLNADGPMVLSRALSRTGALLVHYSTDYVFDGETDHAYTPRDPTGPINEYGRTKLAGEAAIRESGVDHLILRTSLVYGAGRDNFVSKMMGLPVWPAVLYQRRMSPTLQ